jgi:hypothetical protein
LRRDRNDACLHGRETVRSHERLLVEQSARSAQRTLRLGRRCYRRCERGATSPAHAARARVTNTVKPSCLPSAHPRPRCSEPRSSRPGLHG